MRMLRVVYWLLLDYVSLLRVSLVASELGADASDCDVSVLLGLSDAVPVGFLVLVVVCVVFAFGH